MRFNPDPWQWNQRQRSGVSALRHLAGVEVATVGGFPLLDVCPPAELEPNSGGIYPGTPADNEVPRELRGPTIKEVAQHSPVVVYSTDCGGGRRQRSAAARELPKVAPKPQSWLAWLLAKLRAFVRGEPSLKIVRGE